MKDSAVDRRIRGRIVDLRICLDGAPGNELVAAVERSLRRSDALLSREGKEIAVALGGTTAENAVRVIVPRIRHTLMRHNVQARFMVNGRLV